MCGHLFHCVYLSECVFVPHEFVCFQRVFLQAVDHGAALPAVILLLPFVHLVDELEEGALGHGRVPVHGPAQELELLHHAVPVLRLHDTVPQTIVLTVDYSQITRLIGSY